MKLDSLEIQKNIEEKRLVFGIWLEKFLLKNLSKFGLFLSKIFCNFFARKDAVFLSCVFIVLLAIYILSTRDLSFDSAAYMGNAQKISEGKKYYYDFFESNLPLGFFFTIIPLYFAKFFAINAIVSVQFFIYLIGILSTYFSYKILTYNYFLHIKLEKNQPSLENIFTKIKNFFIKKTEIFEEYHNARNLILINITTISFCLAFFFRAYTMQFNEYATKSSYFLAFYFPYISCFFWSNNCGKIQAIRGILGGLLICLKPHYALLIIVFETANFFGFFNLNNNKNDIIKKIVNIFTKNNNSLKSSFISLSLTILIVGIYILLMLKYTPEYFQFWQHFSSFYFEREYFNIFSVVKYEIFHLIFLLIIFHETTKKENPTIFKPLFLGLIGAILIVFSEFIGAQDQRFIIYAAALPLVISQFYILIKKNRINWRKNWLIIVVFLAIAQFDAHNFFVILINLCYFWWITLFLNKKNGFLVIFLVILTIFIFFFVKNSEILWLTCAAISLYLFKKSTKFDNNEHFNTKTTALLTIIFSYILSFMLAGIFNHQDLYNVGLKSPNKFNDKKIAIIKKYAPDKNDKVLAISDGMDDFYTVFNYTQKQNTLPSLHLGYLYRNIYFANKITQKNEIFYGKSLAHKESLEHLFASLKKALPNPDYKIIFIEKAKYFNNGCSIEFLEYYFQDAEFRENFLKNYTYLTEIYKTQKIEITNNPLAKKEEENISSTTEYKYGEIEVYIRKN